MAAGQQGWAESPRSHRTTEPARRTRAGDGASRRAAPGGPAFISDQAEELHHLELERDPKAAPTAKVAARLELARLYERRGHFAEAVEMYERNVWAGARTPATYAGLAAAYRELGREDLAEAALEQVRRGSGAGRSAGTPTAAQSARTTTLPRQSHARPTSDTNRRVDSPRTTARRGATEAGTRTSSQQATRGRGEGAGTDAALGQLQRSVAPFLEGQAGRRTLVASTVLLPIVLGVGIFVAVVLSSARPRTADAPPATPAPVATMAPTAAPTAAPTSAVPAALAQQPAPARLVVSNVGADGLSLRQTPGTTGQRIKVWKDGTEMADLGESAEIGGQKWQKVRDPDGNVGWTAAEFLSDPATRAAAAAPAAPSFASGGLGLTRAEWEQAHGQPTRSSIFLEYAGGRLVVGLLEGNVWHVERVWMRGDAVSLEAAREDARAFLPEDASQVQSVDRGDGRIIDIYSSAQLTNRFGSTAWNGGKAGTFSIQYRFRSAADRMVTSAMFRLGDALF